MAFLERQYGEDESEEANPAVAARAQRQSVNTWRFNSRVGQPGCDAMGGAAGGARVEGASGSRLSRERAVCSGLRLD